MKTSVSTLGSCERREFLKRTLAWGALAGICPASAAVGGDTPPASVRKMKICLSPGNIGVRANMAEALRMAAQYGFEAIEPSMGELATYSDAKMDEFREQLLSKGLSLGAAGTGVPIGGSQQQFSDWLSKLPKQAAALRRAGGMRVVTWISCGDNKLTYIQNFRLHAKRISEIAAVLGDNGLSFGLEYIGPKTSWARQRYPFIHTMQEMKDLIAETGKTSIGFLLDSWHWYTAGEKPADILSLRNEQIIGVHLNDAPAGIAIDQQIDNRRALPAATGVIDIGGFLGALIQVGYDGPVMAEPFDDELRKLTAPQALQRTIDAIRLAFTKVK